METSILRGAEESSSDITIAGRRSKVSSFVVKPDEDRVDRIEGGSLTANTLRLRVEEAVRDPEPAPQFPSSSIVNSISTGPANEASD
jgi:hypothetical protein